MRTVLLTLLVLTTGFADKTKPNSRQATPKETAVTGCLDQRQEGYILSDSADMAKVITLKGKAFSDDNFARFIGQKVTVHGTVEGGTMQVRKISKVADTCSR
jgi:hypothetical protein